MADFTLNFPTPQKNIAAHELLADGETTHHGYITKLRSDAKGIGGKLRGLLTPTRAVLVVLHKGCLYCFNNDTAGSPRYAYSLFGYNKIVRNEEIQNPKRPWVFQIEHVSPDQETLMFSTTTQQMLKDWMNAIKKEMLKANGKTGSEPSMSDRTPCDGNDNSLSDFVEQPIYDDVSADQVMETLTKRKNVSLKHQSTEEEESELYLELADNDDIHQPPQPSCSRKITPTDMMNEMQSRLVNVFKKQDTSSDDKHERKKKNSTHKKSTTKVPNLPSHEELAKVERNRGRELPATPTELQNKQRGVPDGGSFKKTTERKLSETQTAEKPPLQPKPKLGSASKSDAITKEDLEKDESLYWKAHVFDGAKDEAQDLLAKIGEEGTYLVREGAQGQVLVVFCHQRTRKYVIQRQDEKYFLRNTEQMESLEKLLYFYHNNPLPNMDMSLSVPYQIAMLELS